ncbi:hypothetical protein R3P38DRAFT_3167892 [Favolaschia claudopus]|uniref:Uncharacterized protein n=1 Tax=Favolaschia claudopus TaxID=2862362 RepID=A0AAW0E7W3_9AGAR
MLEPTPDDAATTLPSTTALTAPLPAPFRLDEPAPSDATIPTTTATTADAHTRALVVDIHLALPNRESPITPVSSLRDGYPFPNHPNNQAPAPISQKMHLSYWDNLIREYFTPKAIIKLTLWRDIMKNEAKPFGVSPDRSLSYSSRSRSRNWRSDISSILPCNNTIRCKMDVADKWTVHENGYFNPDTPLSSVFLLTGASPSPYPLSSPSTSILAGSPPRAPPPISPFCRSTSAAQTI